MNTMTLEQQFTIGEKTYSLTNWCKIQRVNKRTAIGRMMRGCTPEQAFEIVPMPPRSCQKRGRGKRKNCLEAFNGLQVIRKQVVDSVETGKNARAIRKMAGKTLDEAGQAMGMSRRVIHLLESGEMRWRPERIEAFNQAAAAWAQEAQS